MNSPLLMASLDEQNEDTELLSQPKFKQTGYINFNSSRLRLTILTTLYYFWTIPTLSMDLATFKNGSLSDDDKVAYRLVIAGNAFLLIGSIINGLDLTFHIYRNSNIKYLSLIRFICGAFFSLGAVLHIFAATQKWNVQCVDDDGASWCRSAYYAVDFLAEMFSLVMAYDIICIKNHNYLNIRAIRVMIYSFVLFLTSFMFAMVYGYYIQPLTGMDRDNLSGYWIVAIAAFTIYCSMLGRLFLCREEVRQNRNNLNMEDENIGLSKKKYLNLALTFMLITGTALCWIKPSVIIAVDTQQPLYRKQFLMFISVAMMIAYDLQLV